MTIAAPATLTDFPQSFCALMIELGAQVQSFDTISELSRSIAGDQKVKDIVCKDLPLSEMQPWRNGVISMLNQASEEELKQCGFQLLTILPFCLSAADIYKIETLHPFIKKIDQDNRGMARFLPRDMEEMQELINTIPTINDITIQRHMFTTLWRDESISVPVDERDAAIISTLLTLDAQILKLAKGWPACKYIASPELLIRLVEHGAPELKKLAFSQYYELIRKVGREHGVESAQETALWEDIMGLIKQHDACFVNSYPGAYNLEVMKSLWQSTDEHVRKSTAEMAFYMLEDAGSRAESICLQIRSMVADDKPLMLSAAGDAMRGLGIEAFTALWKLGIPEFNCIAFNDVAEKLSYGDEDSGYVETYLADEDDEDYAEHKDEIDELLAKQRATLTAFVHRALLECSDMLDTLEPARIAAVAAYADSDEVAAIILPKIKAKAAKSKPLQRSLVNVLAKVSPAVYSSWSTDRLKGIRDIAIAALLLNPSEDALSYLLEVRDNKKTSDADIDQINTRVAKSANVEADQSIVNANTDKAANDDSSDPASATVEKVVVSLEQLQEKAAKARLKPQIKKLWTDDLTALFAPLDEPVAQWLMSMTLESKDTSLPTTVSDALSLLSREQQAVLAEYLVNLWLSKNGDIKLRWLSKFVPEFADDRIVAPLWKGFQGWYKRAKPKAVFTMDIMGSLGSSFALSQVLEVYGKNSYSYALQEGAGNTLKDAAARRGINMLDLFDELTPDFGIGPQGLVLDVGPYNYRVAIARDLSLSVCNEETGKITKTFPKVKKSEDANLHASAQSQFKFLNGNLKKVAKQQGKRLHEAMISSRQWPQQRWNTLFMEHPLLGLIAQSIIWVTDTGQTFRISEDKTLVSVSDDEVKLNENDVIQIWHPTMSTIDEIGNWAEYLNDYEINTLIDQVSQPTVELSEQEKNEKILMRFAGLQLSHTWVQRLMNSWNYSEYDGDGSWIASYMCHFKMAEIGVVIELDDMNSFSVYDSETATIQGIVFYHKREVLQLKDVPAPLLSTILGQGNILIEKAAAPFEQKAA